MIRMLKIARREYLSYLRTPGFWISLCVAPLFLAFAVLGGPKLVESTAPPPRLAVVDLTHSGFEAALKPALAGDPPLAELAPPPPEAAAATTPAQAAPPLRRALAGRADGRAEEGLDLAVVISGRPDAARVDMWTRDPTGSPLTPVIQGAIAEHMHAIRLAAAGLSPELLRTVTASQPELRSFSPHARSGQVSFRDKAPGLVAFGLAFVLWMAVMTGAGILLNSVIEEKSGRILEVLMSCASIPEILAGKILGVAALSGTVLAVWGAMALALIGKSSPQLIGGVVEALMGRGLIVWFALFFACGYLMYAAMFAAIGAFCETTREAQTLLGPLMLVMSVPMLFLSVAQQRPDAPVIVWLSWLPPFTPFLMVARIASGLSLWQAAGGLAVMAATAAVIVWLCGRAFRAGALSGGGGRLSLRRLVGAAVGPAAEE
jgi:ABC-2 type transport system permease protein